MRRVRICLTLLAFCAWFAPLAAQTELDSSAPSVPSTPMEAPIAVEAPLDENAPGTETAVAEPAFGVADRPIAADVPVADIPIATDSNSAVQTAPLIDTTVAAQATDDAARLALQSYVDGVALSLQRGHGLAALSVAVVKDDALWLSKAYGRADLADARAADGDTLFRIGSSSATANSCKLSSNPARWCIKWRMVTGVPKASAMRTSLR